MDGTEKRWVILHRAQTQEREREKTYRPVILYNSTNKFPDFNCFSSLALSSIRFRYIQKEFLT